jgi:hypothetical protein
LAEPLSVAPCAISATCVMSLKAEAESGLYRLFMYTRAWLLRLAMNTSRSKSPSKSARSRSIVCVWMSAPAFTQGNSSLNVPDPSFRKMRFWTPPPKMPP